MPQAQFLTPPGLRPVRTDRVPFTVAGLALGQGSSALEVLVCSHGSPPAKPTLRSAWKARHAGRAAPLLLVVLYDGRAALCGPTGDDPPAHLDLDPGQVERICREALDQPDRHAALRALRDSLPSIESDLPGVRNEGFLATHELAAGARSLSAWSDAQRKSQSILQHRGEELLRSLGFSVDRCDQVTSILRLSPAGRKAAVAVLLRQDESPDLNADRFNGLSPVSYAMTVAERENIDYVVVSQGAKLRLYPVRQGVGVGQRGRTETFVEVHTGLLRDTDAAYLWLLFSAEALAEGGTLAHLLEESHRFAGKLADDLREIIYGSVVPRLAEGIAAARGVRKPSAADLAETYTMAMTVLFRLLFIAYAEDKDLLPYRWNGLYERRSLKQKARELVEMRRVDPPFDDSDSLWEEVVRLFRAVEEGKAEWGVPAYNGGLFTSDPEVSRVGALLADITLPNTVFGPALQDLLTIQTPEGWGPVDFRSLGVREFGTVYEGLLESELSIAETDLTTDANGFYRPAHAGDEVEVRKSRIYLHNRSGARKASGSYFTKSFAVEHLLERALEPALRDHFARLDATTDDDGAAERFFDFRIADIAMGSGHFLVAAIDRMERAFTRYLADRPLPRVRAELASLRAAAIDALGPLAEQVEIEDTQLLRRLIARRCVYGVDLNPVSVNLARVSIWIHTFVPGLPLSLLDRNLVVGNSLVGIGQIDELKDIADPDHASGGSLFTLDLKTLVGKAAEPLRRLARIADATMEDMKRARAAFESARQAVAPAQALCDIATASRVAGEALPVDLGKWEEAKEKIVGSRAHKAALKALADLNPLHFPVAFPEVFLRERAGFDVILGNPPWEEATLEEHAFWARHVPGLRGLNQREQEREKARLRGQRADLIALYEQELVEANATRRALVTGPYPGMGTGDPDLYKAFCWRFWNLACADGGWIGVVLPRSALSAKGSAEFREAMLDASDPADITMLVNNRQWVFPDVHPQYSIGLVALRRAVSAGEVRLLGPFRSRERFNIGACDAPAVFTSPEVRSWTDTASLPLLPAEDSPVLFAVLRRHPRLDLDKPSQWRARPHTELHATNDKGRMDLDSRDRPRGFWPVFKGESFDLFTPDTETYYAWADPKVVVPHLHEKRKRGRTRGNSVWFEFAAERPKKWWDDEKTLPCFAPRIAFRDVTNRTNQRTVIAALVPPKVVITNKGPYFLWPRGDEADEAYLLGVLSSLCLDWYARRFVETSVNFFIINPFPAPRPAADDPLRLRLIELAAHLSAIDDRYADWAAKVERACGVAIKVGPLADEQRWDMLCELDAVAAHLYGLKEKHLRHIFETFHEGWGPGRTASHWTLGNYDDRLKRTVGHFRALGKKGAVPPRV